MISRWRRSCFRPRSTAIVGGIRSLIGQRVHVEAKSKGGTLLQLHREYRELYPDGMSYAQFCAQHQEYAKGLKRYLRKSYQAGECVFVDFAGKTMTIHEMGGAEVVRRPIQIFVAALGASHLVYAEAIPSQQIPDWLAAHNRMWAFYSGVTRIIVPDNLKAAVIIADRHNPEILPTYRDHARHYGTQVVPARPRTPKDKGKVEQAVQLVQRWILFRLRKRIFTSLAELNSAIAHLLTELNDAKMRRLGKSRREIFEQIERPALQPLPTTPYEYAEYVKLRVSLDNHVHIDGRDYSVPYQLSGPRWKRGSRPPRSRSSARAGGSPCIRWTGRRDGRPRMSIATLRISPT